MNRREFITLLGGMAAAWPLAARAQQSVGMRRIGVLVSFVERDPDAQSYVDAIVKQLQALGMAASLAAPGGNATGFTHFESAIGGKWLELLKEITPKLSRVAVIFDPNNPSSPVYLRALKGVYPNFRVQMTEGGVSKASEIEQTLGLFSREPNGGLIVLPNPLTQKHRDLIIALAARDRLPVIYPHALYAKSGGLMSYGTDLVDMYRRTATYIDRILRGAKPADLPVQAPTKYELVINLKSARALGLDVPPTLLARADEVIE